MTDPTARRPEAEDEEVFERMLAKHPAPTAEVRSAVEELRAARVEFSESLDELGSATQSALDVPGKIRRNPAKAAALVGGTGFLLVGGPRRVARSIGRRFFSRRPDPHAGLLPPEIEKVLRDSGVARDPEIRRALNKDFAEYLRKKGRATAAEPSAQRSFWRTFDKVAGPLGTAGARLLVQRLMEAEQDRAIVRTEMRDRAIARAEAEKRR